MPVFDLAHLLVLGGAAGLLVSATGMALIAVRRRQY